MSVIEYSAERHIQVIAEENYEHGFKDGKSAGISEGIIGSIAILKKAGKDDATIMEWISEQYNLSLDQVEKYLLKLMESKIMANNDQSMTSTDELYFYSKEYLDEQERLRVIEDNIVHERIQNKRIKELTEQNKALKKEHAELLASINAKKQLLKTNGIEK